MRQIVTFAKIAGPMCRSVRAAALRFAWTKSEGEFGTNPSTNAWIRDVTSAIEANRTATQVVYFDQYVDAWSSGLPLTLLAQVRATQVAFHAACPIGGDDRMAFFLEPENWGEWCDATKAIVASNQRRRRACQEDRWAAARLREGALAWENLLEAHRIPRAMLIWTRSYEVLLRDEELVAGCAELPLWMPTQAR